MTSDSGTRDRVVVLVERAAGALRASRVEEAQRILESDIARNDPRAQNLLGLCYFKRGRLEDAGAIYERLLGRYPREASLHVNLGLVRLRAGDLDGAESSFRRALEHVPHHRRAHGYLGLVLYRRGQLDSAREHFEAGEARDFARRAERRSTLDEDRRVLQIVSQVAELAISDDLQPFRSIETQDGERSSRKDDRGWRSLTEHHLQVPVAEAAEADNAATEAPRSGAARADSRMGFATMTASHEVKAVVEAAVAMAPEPPELLFSLEGSARSNLTLDEVDALESGLGRPGFVAGPGGRAKLTVAETGAIQEAALVLGLGRREFRPLDRLPGWLEVAGPTVLLLSIDGIAVALRELRDAVFAPGVLRGYAGDWLTRTARGGTVALSGHGSALIASTGAPLVVPVARGRQVVCARPALLAWAQTTTVAPADAPDRCLARGPGWVVVSERC